LSIRYFWGLRKVIGRFFIGIALLSMGAVSALAQVGVPPRADFDGDGKADFVVWRPTTGMWWITQSSNGAVIGEQWGMAGDIPLSGDFDGDRKTDYVVWRPSNGVWYIKQSSNLAAPKAVNW
jgi:hypothetical protein